MLPSRKIVLFHAGDATRPACVVKNGELSAFFCTQPQEFFPAAILPHQGIGAAGYGRKQ
jgi:hypothetical protein